MDIPHDATIGECYRPAMVITDQTEADAYFSALVRRCTGWGNTYEEAERIERSNLGYYAGYYDDATRERVEQLFRCAHPIFGAISQYAPPTPAEALEIGKQFAQSKE